MQLPKWGVSPRQLARAGPWERWKEKTNGKKREGVGGVVGGGMVGVGGVRPRRGRGRGGVASVAVKAGGMMGEDALISKTNCRRKVKRDRARARTERGGQQQCGGGHLYYDGDMDDGDYYSSNTYVAMPVRYSYSTRLSNLKGPATKAN